MALLSRDDYRKLFAGSNRPWLLLRHLALGTMEQLTLPDPLPDPESLRNNQALIVQRYDGITVLRQIAAFRNKDTPTRSLYRMCEFLAGDHSNQLMLEMQYFWHHQSSEWNLSAIPDPRESNKERHAIFASLVEALVSAFNARLALGLRRGRELCSGDEVVTPEQAPSWTSKVPALTSPLYLCDVDPYFVPKKEPFWNRNIIANAGNLFSI